MRRPFNIGDALRAIFEGGQAAYDTDLYNQQSRYRQGLTLTDLLTDEMDRQYQRKRNRAADRRADAYLKIAQDKATAAPAIPSIDDILDDYLSGKVQAGELGIDEAFKVKNEIKSRGKKTEEPTDWATKFEKRLETKNRLWSGNAPYVTDPKTGEVELFENASGRMVPRRVPFEDVRDSIAYDLYNKEIYPGIKKEGLEPDSIQALLGIDPITGAMNIPDFRGPYKPGRQLDPAHGARREKAVAALKAMDSAGEWDTLTPQEQEALIQDQMRRM